MAKTNKIYKAEEALRILNYWYEIIDYYTSDRPESIQARKDFNYIRDTILYFNEDKHEDRLRFAKKFKALFSKQTQELAKEVYETRKKLYETKVEKELLEKELDKKGY